jgi:regulator of CtrA degradation
LRKGFARDPAMADLRTLNPRVVEALYVEALVLADEVRARFEQARVRNAASEADDLTRVALSCEALRTTTRVLHCLSWLLNHRAFCAGEVTELQLRLHCPMVVPVPASDPDNEPHLPPAMVEVIHESEHLYDRILRLEQAWRTKPAGPGAVEGLRDKLTRGLMCG